MAREHLVVLDRRSILERVRVEVRPALDHVERVAVEVARAVEPRLVVEVRDVHDEVSPSQRARESPSQKPKGPAGCSDPSVWIVRGVPNDPTTVRSCGR